MHSEDNEDTVGIIAFRRIQFNKLSHSQLNFIVSLIHSGQDCVCRRHPSIRDIKLNVK